MEDTAHRAIAVVGVGAILPDAPSVSAFWANLRDGRYSITEVPDGRWDSRLFYDPDPAVPDKTYSKIGGWVRESPWDPVAWRLPIPPRVSEAMDDGQKWAVACTRQALDDYGYPARPLDLERTAVVLGNAMAGEKHYLTALRVHFPEFAEELAKAPSFAALPHEVRSAIARETHQGVARRFPEITEDTMPGELGNILAGRVANVFNFRGPNFVVDAACASALAAISAAMEGLVGGHFDAAVTGGVDRNMGAAAFVKFSKIGALSATGTRPYADGADGFVMGEGAAVFLLKRLGDAERAGDTIYAVLRGIGGASDGKGKGITAPNPVGQRLALERAWRTAGLDPRTATLVEGHGTSTRVGDVVEVESLSEVFGGAGAGPGAIALGSVKSNIGHLKAAAGAAGLLKTVLALHHEMLPPSLHCEHPNPNIDFARSPLRVNRELRPWEVRAGDVRRAGVSAFGFGGTNFHAVVEEYVPGRLATDRVRSAPSSAPAVGGVPVPTLKAPARGALVLGQATPEALAERLRAVAAEAAAGGAPAPCPPAEADLRAPERLAIDYGDAGELADRAAKALKALATDAPAAWKALRAQGIFRGRAESPKLAFLYAGQGSQYVNMLRALSAAEPIVAETFAVADRVMTPLLGRPLTDHVFVPGADADALARAEEALRQTAVTQPAVLTADLALTRLLAAYGIVPDFVMGHSLGEYGALVAARALRFEEALEAVSARGREMANLTVEDHGIMAAVFAPLADVERILASIEGYVVIANVNSTSQSVIGGASDAVERAIATFQQAGFTAVRLPVSHAFHTRIVAPASEPLRRVLARLHIEPPAIPVIANVSGEFYPADPGTPARIIDILAAQVASPVQFVKGLETLYAAGARVFVEVGPKRALQGFVDDVLGRHGDVASLFTNHPKLPDAVAFNQALCGLYAAGHGIGATTPATVAEAPAATIAPAPSAPVAPARGSGDGAGELRRLVTEFVHRAAPLVDGAAPALATPVVISGAALGTPGTERIFDDANLGRLLDGAELIDVIPAHFRHAMLDKHITRLVKSDEGEPRFETIDREADVIKLAGRGRAFDLEGEFGIASDRVAALDRTTQLAVAAGIDALRDAGIPLVMRYRTTSKGTRLPERWELPEALRDETGIIFASCFPGYGEFAADLARYHADRARHEQLRMLEGLQRRLAETANGPDALRGELERLRHGVRATIDRDPYRFDRRFLFRVLAMGHSQFAELIGARGPNTQINSACASTTQAVALAEDWIGAGRCRRVIIVAADDVTSDRLLEWFGAGFLATGAAATDETIEEAALPFDRRRHGMILGMGAAALVVESATAARERGLQPICEVVATATANSAFHGTRLDVEHIGAVMERLVAQAEARTGVSREAMGRELVFVSHETYTPARGGSAAAEVNALRRVFGHAGTEIVVANTKGFTGHPMGVGIEDVVAVKALETGIVPPVANFRDVDPDLGPLHLSRGGYYPVEFALRLGAGFGSQISLTLFRRVPPADGRRRAPDELGHTYRIADRPTWAAWLARVSGQAAPELEVVHRTLRVRDQAAAGRREAEPARVTTGPPAAPPTVTPAAVPAAPAAGPATAEDPVRTRVLAIVAEKTGYPPDMLDLDLDLEADLGVDTVKQAETFAAVRAAYDIPRDDKLKLRDFPTLAHVIRFVHERRPGLAAPPPAAVPAAAVPSGAAADDPVRARVLAIVAEKTGYPPDMLDLDLDLEADLGVDTVKQAETFAAVRAAYDIPRDDKLKLRDFPTLAHVIGFVHERRGKLAPGASAAAPAPSKEDGREPRRGATLEEAERVPRRVPVPVVRPALDLCKATGVVLGAGSRVLVMADRGGVAQQLVGRVQALGAQALVVDDAPSAEALAERLRAWLADGPVQGLYWLPALDREPEIEALDLAGWREALRVRVKLLHATLRALDAGMDEAGRFVVVATRLGGRHGYDDGGAVAAMGGAVTGFAKAYRRERAALVKAVDVTAAAEPAAVADVLVAETLTDPGTVEVGHAEGLRWTVGLVGAPAADGQPGMSLGREGVFVVTGAAGGIVSAIVADLAAASGGTFHLLDRIPEPRAGDPDLARFASSREELKRELVDRLKARGERATPALVERQLAALERAQAALAAIHAVREAGGEAHYHTVDLTDAAAVAAVVDDVRRRHGRIDVLVHAAGVEVSHLLADKPPAEFDLVFDVKCDGWFNLLHAVGDMPLAATVAFSSIAGRFGNRGQTDYSAANDLLCKLTSHLAAARPATRALAIDWTAWAGIGMASRGSIPTMMAQAGIDMLPAAAGVPVVRRELVAGGARGEVVIADRLGMLVEEGDPTGGLDPARAASATQASGPMLGRVTGIGVDGWLRIETSLDPRVQPFLADHRIDGTAVLPGVMGIEAFAEAATLLVPGWHVVSVEDVTFHAPFKFYRDEPRTLRVEVLLRAAGDELLAGCRLIGSRQLTGQEESRDTVHFTGRVRLARRAPAATPLPRPAPPNGAGVGAEDIYRLYFHGPAYRVLERAWRDGESTVGLMAEGLGPNHAPATRPTLVAPRLIELCFQTAGVAELAHTGRMALPERIAELRAFPWADEGHGRLYAVVMQRPESGFDAHVVDAAGNVRMALRGYRTVALPEPARADDLRPLQSAVG